MARVCKECGNEKPDSEFQRIKSKGAFFTRGRCKDCYRIASSAWLKKYRAKSGHKIQARHRERLATDPEYHEYRKRIDREKYQRNKEHRRAWQIAYRARNREKCRESGKNKRLKKEYGITLAEFREMLSSQGNCCLICHAHVTESIDAHIDHCHKSGKVRGVLCRLCNIGLGAFRDNRDFLRDAILYLERNETPDQEPQNDSDSSLET